MGKAFQCDVCGGLLAGAGGVVVEVEARPDLKVQVEVYGAELDGAGKVKSWTRGPICGTCAGKIKDQVGALAAWAKKKEGK